MTGTAPGEAEEFAGEMTGMDFLKEQIIKEELANVLSTMVPINEKAGDFLKWQQEQRAKKAAGLPCWICQ